MGNNQTHPFNSVLACNSFAWFANQTLKNEGSEELSKGVYFKVTDNNKTVIKSLVHYFCSQPGALNLEKGIMLQGPVGTGKSTIMRLFSYWLRYTRNSFRVVRCRDIQKEAAKDGFAALAKYGKSSYNRKNNVIDKHNGFIIYCFDDFGAEEPSKFYGNEINVMQEVIEDRYVEFDLHGMLSHGTTNIRDWDIGEQKYGLRVRDRMRQMFNFVELNGPSFRR